MLTKLAIEDKDETIRSFAVKKLTDQALLAKLAVEDQDNDVRRAAINKLTDQGLLAKLAVEDQDKGIRWAAVEKLTDQGLLAKLAVEHKDEYIRNWAVGKLTDQGYQILLAKQLAIEDKESDVSQTAKKPPICNLQPCDWGMLSIYNNEQVRDKAFNILHYIYTLRGTREHVERRNANNPDGCITVQGQRRK